MSLSVVAVPELRCLRCRHAWIPRQAARPPTCPKCRNHRWDEPQDPQTDHAANLRELVAHVNPLALELMGADARLAAGVERATRAVLRGIERLCPVHHPVFVTAAYDPDVDGPPPVFIEVRTGAVAAWESLDPLWDALSDAAAAAIADDALGRRVVVSVEPGA